MPKNDKETIWQKLKTWWHNLPHRGFLIFQLFLPIISSILLPILIDISDLLAIYTHIGLWIIQLCIIKHYYGWKTCLFALLATWIWWLTTVCFGILGFLGIFLPPIIPQYWRLTKHGRK